MLFEFGRGLLDRGDAAGVEFMSPKYWAASGDLSQTLYYAEEPLKQLAKVRSPQGEAVLKEIIELPSLRAGFLFDEATVTVSTAMAGGVKGITPETILKNYQPRLIERYRQLTAAVVFQQAKQLMGPIEVINLKTKDEQIRNAGRQAISTLVAQ